jgi:hypothetical protein
VIVGSGKKLWLSTDNGDRWTSQDLELWSDASEVHAGDYPIVLTPKELFYHYHETGIGPGKNRSDLRQFSRRPSPFFFARGASDIPIWHLADGRQARMASHPGNVLPDPSIPDAP